ncbi:MAG: M15 family metallopeptidase, partial [Defluviitaleaceae bacterium]|nr:M15 family metallopeptidase [Defluviitaleaceae bacterium]
EYAEDEGLRPIVRSAHRGIATQRTLFDNQVQRNVSIGLDADEAFEAARRVVAYPGSSEHNLGLGIDIVSYFYQNLTAHFGQTEEGRWLAQNAHRFGFVLRYPYHQQHITNIIYEPWHFRYVGIDHAAAMFENDVVLEQYVFWLQSQ